MPNRYEIWYQNRLIDHAVDFEYSLVYTNSLKDSTVRVHMEVKGPLMSLPSSRIDELIIIKDGFKAIMKDILVAGYIMNNHSFTYNFIVNDFEVLDKNKKDANYKGMIQNPIDGEWRWL